MKMIWEEGTNSAVAFHTQLVVCLIAFRKVCSQLSHFILSCLSFNSFTPKISFVILFTVCRTILMIIVGRIWYGISQLSLCLCTWTVLLIPLNNYFLYSHYFLVDVDNVWRSHVLVTLWSQLFHSFERLRSTKFS